MVFVLFRDITVSLCAGFLQKPLQKDLRRAALIVAETVQARPVVSVLRDIMLRKVFQSRVLHAHIAQTVHVFCSYL